MLQRPPKPEGHWLLGSYSEFQADPLKFLSRTAQSQGDISCFRMGPAYIYLINHPDLIHQIFVEQTENFYKSNFAKKSLGKMLGNGLVLSDGDFWKRQRRLAQPAFHHNRIASYAEEMVNSTLAMLNNWQPGKTVQVDQQMSQLALAIMSNTIFVLDTLEESEGVSSAIADLQAALSKRLLAAVPLPDWIPTSNNLKAKQALQTLDNIIFGIIEQRRKSGEDKGDVISMLLMARDDDGAQMSDQQLRDELLTLFIAGHETTANLLTWTWYLISQHPEVEAKLYDELKTVLDGRTTLTYQDLPALKYNDMVIKEVLRLYPPAWIIVRQPFEDATIGDYRIKKGTTVFVSPYVIHHDARFYPEPERFMPERFAPEAEAKIPHYAYIPFSGGPRICIGISLATMEARLIIATVMQQFRLRYEAKQPLKPSALLTLVPEGGLTMRVEKRDV
jgi:cytochrome P450